MENLKEQIDKEGYVVVPNVFSSEELDDIALTSLLIIQLQRNKTEGSQRI